MGLAFGNIYILTNPVMPGLVKVGFTGGSVDDRARDLASSTGVPESFVVEFYGLYEKPKAAESRVHTELKHLHHNKEYFNCSPQYAVDTVLRVLGEPISGKSYERRPYTEKAKAKVRQQEKIIKEQQEKQYKQKQRDEEIRKAEGLKLAIAIEREKTIQRFFLSFNLCITISIAIFMYMSMNRIEGIWLVAGVIVFHLMRLTKMFSVIIALFILVLLHVFVDGFAEQMILSAIGVAIVFYSIIKGW